MRTNRSLLWNYFVQDPQYSVNHKAVCNICHTEVLTSGNTSNLKHHLQNKHSSPDDNIFQQYLNEEAEKRGRNAQNSAASAEASTSGTAPVRRRRRSESEVVPHPRDGAFMQTFFSKLVKFIATDMQPIQVVENEGFKELIKFLDPKIELPCRSTITNNLIPAEYKKQKDKVKAELEKPEFVALTTDCWSSRNLLPFMTVTVHYIKNAEMISRVLSTFSVPESHTADNLALRLEDVAKEWGIADKVVCVVTDNGANIVRAVNLLAAKYQEKRLWQWVPCVAHTLQLAIKDALSGSLFYYTLKQCRDVITFFHTSHLAVCTLNKHCLASGGINGRQLQQEVVTRWNTQFLMVTSMLDLKDQINATLGELLKPNLMFTEEQWDLMKDFVKILAPCEQISRELSSQKYPSISRVLPLLKLATGFLSKNQEEGTENGPTFTASAILKRRLFRSLRTRFHNMEEEDTDRRAPKWPFFSVATFLDPRFKSMYHSDASRVERKAIILLSGATHEEEVRPREPSSSLDSLWGEHDARVNELNANARRPTTNGRAHGLNLVREYKQMAYVDRKEDPLQWWHSKADHSIFKNFSPIVKKIFCIPATSVPSESAFSAAGELISPKRSKLSPEMAEMLLFLHKP